MQMHINAMNAENTQPLFVHKENDVQLFLRFPRKKEKEIVYQLYTAAFIGSTLAASEEKNEEQFVYCLQRCNAASA